MLYKTRRKRTKKKDEFSFRLEAMKSCKREGLWYRDDLQVEDKDG